ncbi:MAG: DUF4430 domain-containing protein [Patescibacteria group bacterium]
MKHQTHVGYTVAVVALGVAFMTALALFGYTVEQDVAEIAQQRYDAVQAPVPSGQVAGVAVELATVSIDRGNGNSISYQIEVSGETTVLDALELAADQYGLEIKTTEYDFGTIVDGIGGMLGGFENQYWIYYIDGVMAVSSVDTQIVEPGDMVEFRFEESTF